MKLPAVEAILVVSANSSCNACKVELKSTLQAFRQQRPVMHLVFGRLCFHNNLLEQNSQTITAANSVTDHRSAAYENQVNVQKKRIATF